MKPQKEYTDLFLMARKYDDPELIAKYFKRVFKKRKKAEFESLDLFKHEMNQAYEYYKNKLHRQWLTALNMIAPDKISKNDIELPIEGQRQTNLPEIERIKAGYDRFIYDKKFAEVDNSIQKLVSVMQQDRKRPITHRARGIALILAFKAGKIDQDTWYSKALKTEAERLFNIPNGHWTNRKAKEWLNDLDRCKQDHPEDYQNGAELYKKIF